MINHDHGHALERRSVLLGTVNYGSEGTNREETGQEMV